jgi:GAF domain-containing protein
MIGAVIAPGDFNRLLAAAAREMAAERSTDDTLQSAVGLATQIVEGCDLAGISLIRKDRWVATPYASHEDMRLIDEEQFELGEGPCVDALRDMETVSSTDVANDPRWPLWGPKVAAGAGVHSCVCVRLFTSGASLGALSLYSCTTEGFTSLDIDHAVALAAQVALAFQGSEQQRNFEVGLVNRTVIGQAVGIVMERFSLDPDTAFKVLARLSSHGNVKLVDIARVLVTTGNLPQASPNPDPDAGVGGRRR